MINLLSESAYIAQTNKIKTAITNKVNAIKASFTRIGEKLGATIHWLDDVESTLDDELTAINTELTDKGSTQADDFSEVAEKISDIQTGITPTGQIAITANGTYDVTDYASASVAVPDSELVSLVEGTMTELENAEISKIYDYSFYLKTFLKKVVLDNCTTVGREAFRQSGVLFASLKKCTSVGQYCFTNSNIVTTVFDSITSFSSAGSFQNASRFKNLILGKRASIYGVALFQATPFRNGTGGTVFCRYADVSWYQSATNWSALESTTFSAIEESLVTLNTLGVDITDYYEIVTELPTSDIATDKVYFIETATSGTFEQWFYGSGSWVQLADITLGGSL